MSSSKLFRNFQKSHFLMEESRRTFKYVSLKLKSKKLAYFTTGCHNFFLCKFLRSLPFVKSICKKLKATSLTHTFYQSFVLGPSCNVFSSKFQVTLHFCSSNSSINFDEHVTFAFEWLISLIYFSLFQALTHWAGERWTTVAGAWTRHFVLLLISINREPCRG